MKSIHKRLAALLCAVLLLLPVLSGCGGKTGQTHAAELTIAAGGQTQCRIIYGSGCAEDVVEAAGYLQREIRRLTGAEMDVCEDMAVAVNADSCEILLCATDRPEDDLSYGAMERIGDWTVRVQGNKLTVAVSLSDCLMQAVQDLCDALSEHTENGTLTLPGGFEISGSAPSGPVADLPVLDGGSFLAATDGGNGTELAVYRAGSAACDAYLTKLERAGYARYTDREIDGNRYFTYLGNGQTLTVMDNPAMGTVRISVDPEEYRLDLAAQPLTAKVQPSVTLLGLEGYETNGSATQTGLSMLYQLSDGSFIVVDGGHNQELAARQLYEMMVHLAPDPGDITIAAWLITHSHNDHAGAFLSFRRNYARHVKLEKLLVNFPSEAQYNAAETSTYYRDNVLADAMYYPDAQIIKVHPGQVFYLRDAVIEVLYTLDLYEPEALSYFNTSSIVCTVALAGQKVLQTGDCSEEASGILVQNYTGALRCDILQVAHHGAKGGTEALYRAADPLYVLWPSGSTAFNTYKTASNNTWLLNESRMKRLWTARSDMITLPLPLDD